jgi:hypothetical protein
MGAILKRTAKRVARAIPALRRVIDERDQFAQRFGPQLPFVPNGHFYSPVPLLDEVRANEERIFGPAPDTIPGVDLRRSHQRQLLEGFAALYESIPFTQQKQVGRYFYDNPAYSYSDAIFLHCMIRHARPKKIVEVGSGYSSCATLDTNELFFGNSIECTFIEPYPALLKSLVRPSDIERIRILPHRVQDVDMSIFEGLAQSDILFIDSTHVSKIGSDVNRLFFEILPALTSGVYIHFHDIFYPFEYPREWIYEGRAWNEIYTLRAFLQYNDAFEIVCFNTYLQHFFYEFFAQHMPLCLKNTGGSIWLRKL